MFQIKEKSLIKVSALRLPDRYVNTLTNFCSTSSFCHSTYFKRGVYLVTSDDMHLSRGKGEERKGVCVSSETCLLSPGCRAECALSLWLRGGREGGRWGSGRQLTSRHHLCQQSKANTHFATQGNQALTHAHSQVFTTVDSIINAEKRWSIRSRGL